MGLYRHTYCNSWPPRTVRDCGNLTSLCMINVACRRARTWEAVKVGADGKWSFLVPVAFAAAALLGTTKAEVETKPSTLELRQKDELTVKAPAVAAQVQHSDHESHSSHRSHRSHYSSR